MTSYLVTWARFEEYVANRDRAKSSSDALSTVDQAESDVRVYVWKRFRRCNDPLVASSLYPKSGSCEPADFTTPEKWDASYKKLIKLKKASIWRHEVRWYTHNVNTIPDDDDPGGEDFWDWVRQAGLTTRNDALDRLETEQLRSLVALRFNTDMPYGPELRQAVLDVLGTFVDTLKDSLDAQLPGEFDSTDAGRQRLSRGTRRVRDELTRILGAWRNNSGDDRLGGDDHRD